ncbi:MULTISPECIES: hypothetical protein [unclassified Streptomyces]|uniref:hypothetical protein n=1 Tax=unclassified Streptomyces TaxID=2593676 RepID=UPI0013694F47|nr:MULTISPECIES: hypothetical protein [unclassified Streptomyces]NEA03711.1 hypothetical protein [Streptomyces sp. SID10116]MYY79683.1 hypothetical protein [Streptomyces sp. SID335]MYZ12843.1 hypothetical protein [Streptomyces sp. SID337]NDZ91147.1 hypothetical protein [Streptomyces sp. SID10115]NEB43544.1 hypothetical protein [Streptomyces sp. SID339]
MSAIRDDILAGLRASEDATVGDATPEQILDAFRAEVIREIAKRLDGRGLPAAAAELYLLADAVEAGESDE